MKKHLFKILILISIYSISQTNSEISKEKNIITDFTFFDPMFKHKNQKNLKSIYDNYERLTSYTLDSLFLVDSKKYMITEKLSYKKTEISEEIESELELLFSFAKMKKNEFEISPKLKSILSKANNLYGIFILINPVGGPSPVPGIGLINKTSVEIIILDLSEYKIVYYGKSKKVKTLNVGYSRALIRNLDYLYQEINKL